jgi:hypothetical protein
MSIEQMRPWAKTLSPVIRAGCAFLAVILLFCCSKQKGPDTQIVKDNSDQAEVEGLKQQVAQLQATVSKKDEALEKLQQRPAPAVVTSQVPPTTDSPTQTPAPPNSGSAGAVAQLVTRSIIEQDIVFQLKACALSGSLMKCDILVTNKGGDRRVYFARDGRSRFIDDSGSEYPATSFALGAAVGGSAETIVPGDVSMKAQVQFDGVKPGTKKVQLLEMYCRITGSNGWKDTVLKFGAIEL